jgi:hypothetical protein
MLDAEDVRLVTVQLPASGEERQVRVLRRHERRFVGVLPGNFRVIPNKVAVEYLGEAVYPEFAIIRRLEAQGWEAAWRKNWHGAAFWTDIGAVANVPDIVQARFFAVADLAGAGAWDVMAWREHRILFVESKQAGSDRLTSNQRRWLEVALELGMSLDSFAVHEYIA